MATDDVMLRFGSREFTVRPAKTGVGFRLGQAPWNRPLPPHGPDLDAQLPEPLSNPTRYRNILP
jgi:hypothetical protein